MTLAYKQLTLTEKAPAIDYRIVGEQTRTITGYAEGVGVIPGLANDDILTYTAIATKDGVETSGRWVVTANGYVALIISSPPYGAYELVCTLNGVSRTYSINLLNEIRCCRIIEVDPVDRTIGIATC